MKKLIIGAVTFFVVSAMTAVILLPVKKEQDMLRPSEGDEENPHRRQEWAALRHSSRAGTEWQEIELRNLLANLDGKNRRGKQGWGAAQYANGLLEGTWEEKGSNNIAGNVKAVNYNAATNTLYLVADEGSLWKKNLAGGDWILLNHDYRFQNNILALLPLASGGQRILLVMGKDIWYSDDEGATFHPAVLPYTTGIKGDNIVSIAVLKDASHSVFCLTSVTDGSGSAQTWLCRSTDGGSTFTRVKTLAGTGGYSMCNPYNSNALYLLDLLSDPGALRLSSIQGTTVTPLSSTMVPGSNSNATLVGTQVNGTTTLYAFIDAARLYRSDNGGQSWAFKGTFQVGATPNVSMDHPDRLFCGDVDAYRSYDGGASWTPVNFWTEYFGDEEAKLHADIMAIRSFRRSDGSSFVVVNTHGGSYLSNDDLQTVQNISLRGLRTAQVYDVLTDPLQPGHVFIGTQDQGLQRTTWGTGLGVVDFEVAFAGDGLRQVLTTGHLWAQFPRAIYYYTDPFSTAYPTSWRLPGNQLSGGGWSTPMKQVGNEALNEILVGGGNLDGGPGAYLIRLKASGPGSPQITATQYNFDFRQHSGGAGISAIETLPQDTNRMYVATENGKFFYSADAGATWQASASQGPFSNVYGAAILGSRKTAGLVWLAGAGYASPPVVRSVDGGKTFTAMSRGLPATLVNEIVANPEETFLFAATDAGPYVYSVADDQWYSMIGPNNPTFGYNSVEYIKALNTVRFSTYGRGIWDFKVGATPPVTIAASGPVAFCEGGTVQLRSSATAGNQWYRDGQPLSGATAATLDVTQGGAYSVVVTGGSGTRVSSTVPVTVNPIPPAPVITAEGPTAFCQGVTTTLRATEARVTKWYKNGNFDPQYKSNYYVAWSSGAYTARVLENGCTSALSNSIVTVVTELPVPPVISGPGEICGGSAIQLASSVDRNLQWYRNGVVIPGATQPNLTTNEAGDYRVSSSNTCGVRTSPVKTVTATTRWAKPSIAVAGATTFCTGASVLLSAGAGRDYQWYNGTVAVSVADGGTASSIAVRDGGTYSLRVGSGTGCESEASEPVVVTVQPVPAKPVITPPGSTAICQGTVVVLAAPLADRYQWYKGGSAISLVDGGTARSITTGAEGLYAVRTGTADCMSEASEPIAVTVNAIPSKPLITATGNVLFSSAGTGNQWYFNGAPVQGATASQHTPLQSGAYAVQVTQNGCSSSLSEPYTFVVTGINDPVVNDIKVYPNPVEDQLFLSNPQGRALQVVITNITGQEVLRYKTSNKISSVSTNQWAKGMYVVRVSGQRDGEKRYSVVKQ